LDIAGSGYPRSRDGDREVEEGRLAVDLGKPRHLHWRRRRHYSKRWRVQAKAGAARSTDGFRWVKLALVRARYRKPSRLTPESLIDQRALQVARRNIGQHLRVQDRRRHPTRDRPAPGPGPTTGSHTRPGLGSSRRRSSSKGGCATSAAPGFWRKANHVGSALQLARAWPQQAHRQHHPPPPCRAEMARPATGPRGRRQKPLEAPAAAGSGRKAKSRQRGSQQPQRQEQNNDGGPGPGSHKASRGNNGRAEG